MTNTLDISLFRQRAVFCVYFGAKWAPSPHGSIMPVFTAWTQRRLHCVFCVAFFTTFLLFPKVEVRQHLHTYCIVAKYLIIQGFSNMLKGGLWNEQLNTILIILLESKGSISSHASQYSCWSHHDTALMGYVSLPNPQPQFCIALCLDFPVR